jgi:hypothetical protein
MQLRYGLRIVPLVFGAYLLGGAPLVSAGGQQRVALVTEQTPMSLSSFFGIPSSPGMVNQAGDYAFMGKGASAVFFRPAGAAAAVRVMQRADEVPGFPGSRADSLNGPILNNAGVLAFHVDFALASGHLQSAIVTFNGTSLALVASGLDIAPGTGGAHFERNLALSRFNDNGDVLMFSNLVPNGTTVPGRPTLFIAPGGGAPVRVAGFGDAAPGTAGGTFGQVGMGAAFNSLGQVLFSSSIVGGSGGSGLFVGTTTSVRKVVTNGDPIPGGGGALFPSPLSGGVRLNNAGQVLFSLSNGLWLDTPPAGISKIMRAGDAAPAFLGGTLGTNQPSFQQQNDLDDAGEIAFVSNVAGSAVTNRALFRYRPPSSMDVVAYRGQAAPGAAGQDFFNFGPVSMNSSGTISFLGANGSSDPIGIFQQSGGGAPADRILEGAATPLGGVYRLSTLATGTMPTLDSGAVKFHAEIPGGAADYAEFLTSGGAPAVLMSTADTLPAGARVGLSTFLIRAAGGFVGFGARYAGGRFSIGVHDIAAQTTTVIATDGAIAPGTGGGHLTLAGGVNPNANGVVALSAGIIGGSANATSGLFTGTPGGGLAKVAVDTDLDSVGGIVGDVGQGTSPSKINAAGQTVFFGAQGPSQRLYVGSAGSIPERIAAVGDGLVTGFTFPGQVAINASGQVAFVANTAAGVGVFVGAAGSAPIKVAAFGDPAPGGGTFSQFAAPDFNGSGEVAFMATVTGGSGGGVFLGSPSTAPVALALNGSAAPTGGNFSITSADPDVLINDQHDVVFRANLAGGTAGSGYFIRRGPSGALETLVLEGQPAPGTAGVFARMEDQNGTVSTLFQLGPSGDLSFFGRFLGGGLLTAGEWHARTDNTIEKVLVRGEVAPEFGGGAAVIHGESPAWNSSAPAACGRYPLFVGMSGGTFADGIFLFASGSCLGTLAPANVWLGLKNSDDVGTKFDLRVEVLKNAAVISSGQVNSVPGGSSGFNNAAQRTVSLSPIAPGVVVSGDTLGLRVSVRIAATGHRSGTARLWFNDSVANSGFGATIGGVTSQFYLTGTAAPTLRVGTPGVGPRRSVDVTVDRAVGGNPFKPFGTWTLIWP